MPCRSLKIQQDALSAIAANRHPSSQAAGLTVSNADGLRPSKDIDIFRDLLGDESRVELLKETVALDAASLESACFEIDWKPRHPEL